MVINGKQISLTSCMRFNNIQTAEFIWVAYDDSKARLPIAIASTADELAKIMQVSKNSVESVWSKFRNGKLKTTKYAKVYIGGEENESEAGN